jgi:hypothetical protein
MRKLVAITAFAAVAFTVQSAAACDWNRQASTGQQTAAAATPAPQTQQAAPAASQTSAVAVEATRKPVEEVVLVSDHR